MFKVDTKDIQNLTDALRDVSRSAYPLAVRSTLNKLAFETKKLASSETIPHTFTTRNTFIEKSVQYERSENTFSIGAMQARAGQVSDYLGKRTDQLDKQEHGQPVVAKGNYTFAATPAARGGNYNKPILKRYYFPKMEIKKLDDLVKAPTQDEGLEIPQACGYSKHNNVTINVIAHSPKLKKYGVFHVKPDGKGGKASLIYALNNKVNPIKRTPWLRETAKKVGAKVNEIFIEEARKRIEKELAKKLKRS